MQWSRAFIGISVVTLLCGPAISQERVIETQAGRLRVQTVAEKLDHPWGLAFLPDGRMLITERSGRLRVLTRDGAVSAPVAGVPPVFARGQGGLLDVVIDPDFEANGLVYISYAEPGERGASTAVARGKLADSRLQDVHVIFRQQPKVDGANHFGSRLVFARDGKLFVTLGERFKFDPAQEVSNHLGTIVRINPDGSVPQDNPFANQRGARPEIWSYGHRNVQGAALHPESGVLWAHEMGPRGGDELNVVEPGHNYGWPLVSWGRHYDGRDIPNPPTRSDFTQPIRYWDPAISPSGMTFYTSDTIAGWRGNLLIGGLSSQGLVRLTLRGSTVAGEERISLGARVRNVRQGPDGSVYVLTDESNGKLLRLVKVER
jgi:glucose/arabinose dehydrogenase